MWEHLKQHECQKCERAGSQAGLEQKAQTEPIAGMPAAVASAPKDNNHPGKASKRYGNLSDPDERLREVLLCHRSL